MFYKSKKISERLIPFTSIIVVKMKSQGKREAMKIRV